MNKAESTVVNTHAKYIKEFLHMLCLALVNHSQPCKTEVRVCLVLHIDVFPVKTGL